jgi:hypothetical protein
MSIPDMLVTILDNEVFKYFPLFIYFLFLNMSMNQYAIKTLVEYHGKVKVL